MFDVAPVLICLGILPAPDLSNCTVAKNVWGPYSTLQECEERASEIKETWPLAFAIANHYTGPVLIGPVKCERIGQPT
jgi:hypothetical protein